jgi:glycosyltransferase involved in cell wall biosynthesis
VKLIIQIPCLNEAETLPAVLADLPATLPGITTIETLIIDDGSTDGTATVARQLGVTHIVRHKGNLGLARAFQTGLENCLRLGADVIVHTDADNQYPGRYIADLVAPVVAGRADMVIGNRPIDEIAHFSRLKKWLQRAGSRVVRAVSGTDVPDTVSGFRAYSREAALRFHILTRFSYTLDTIIQAGKLGLPIVNVPITTNDPTRPSRLQRHMGEFIKRQAATIVRLYAFYEPLRTFSWLALPFLLGGMGLIGRFIAVYLTTANANRYIQSVSIGTGLLIMGILIALFGVQADIADKHRQLTQETLYRLKKLEYNASRVPPSHADETDRLPDA